MKPNWQPVTSSQIKRIAHDEESQTCFVQFNTGGLYAYSKFPAEKFAEFQKAESAGKFLGASIKGNHEFQRITDKALFQELTGECVNVPKGQDKCNDATCELCNPPKS